MIRIGLALLLVTLIFPASTGGAEVVGDCEVQVDGVDVENRDADDADEAIEIPAGETADMSVQTSQPIDRWNASIRYGPLDAPLTRGEAPVNATSVQVRIPVRDFSWLGSGLYEVQGDVTTDDGEPCSAEALVEIQGSPIGTVLGTTATSMAGLGAFGLLAALRSGYKQGKIESRRPQPVDDPDRHAP